MPLLTLVLFCGGQLFIVEEAGVLRENQRLLVENNIPSQLRLKSKASAMCRSGTYKLSVGG